MITDLSLKQCCRFWWFWKRTHPPCL